MRDHAVLRRGDDRGSLSLYLVVALVGLMLGALLVPMVVTSARSTRFSSTRVQALSVAQAGTDVALGKIRSASDDGIGDAAKLPCTSVGSPITGKIGSAAYSVTVDYYTVDPIKNPSAVAMMCIAGYGTYEASSGTAVPSYALLTAAGTVGAAVNGTTSGRTLISTYVLQTSSVNLAGGVIRIDSGGNAAGLCIDAGSATPAISTALVLQACSTTTPPAAQQTFAYRSDLTLQLVSSVGTAYPRGLCITTAAPPQDGNAIVLASCPAEGAAPSYSQQWSYNDNGKYQASLSTSSTNGNLADQCFSVGAPSAGQPVVLASCGWSYGWVPAPTVGAGAAVAPQWVNANEFGRCLDVTNQDVNIDHLIDYPCKQNPYGGAVRWNQKFTPPTPATGDTSATGQFYTQPDAKYCLTSPLTAGGWVTVRPCVPLLAAQQWTVFGGAGSLQYSKKYIIVDNASRCLSITDPKSGEVWSAIKVDTCDGSTAQKWNASPNLTTPTLQNIREK